MASQWFKVGAGLVAGVAASIVYMTLNRTGGDDDSMMVTGEFDLRVDERTGELIKCPKTKLIAILEDLQMEYTPYFTHYYHLLTALQKEYKGKPILQQKLADKICNKLDEKTKQIQNEIVEKYMVEGESAELAAWIAHYCEKDGHINGIINLFQINEDRLFLKSPPEKPDFQLSFNRYLTKNTYISIVKKVFAVMRHYLYKEIRAIRMSRGTSTALSHSSVSGTSKNYLTKNELRRVLEEIDIGQIRQKVFELYGVTTDKESEQRTLLKAFYTHMSDVHFEQEVRLAKQNHERFTTAIIQCDVFPNLDKVNPLNYPEEDDIPQKFGPKWFEYQKNRRQSRDESDRNGVASSGQEAPQTQMIKTTGDNDGQSSSDKRRRQGNIDFELLQINDEDYLNEAEADQDEKLDRFVEANEQIVANKAKAQMAGLPEIMLNEANQERDQN